MPKIPPILILPALTMAVLAIGIYGFLYLFKTYRQQNTYIATLTARKSDLEKQLEATKVELDTLKNQDQYKRNEELQQEINNINKIYKDSLAAYDQLLDLKTLKVKTERLDADFAQILKLLAERNYALVAAVLADLNKKIDAQKTKTTANFKITEIVAVNNQPPTPGYRRQNVQTDIGSFLLDIISADLNSTRVIVDTASESNCSNNCPVLPLVDYVSRNGAFAGINGSFFCPETYPECAGKTNSFDTLLMNKNKKYFNSDNNVYSTIPAVIFSGNTARFVPQSLEWGRDTGVDAVIANHPLYLLGGHSAFAGSPEAKLNNKGTRSFIGTTGSTVYIGVIHNASSTDAVQVLKTLGLQNALGLDQGGSIALWYGSYKVGPGRNIPNAVLLVRK